MYYFGHTWSFSYGCQSPKLRQILWQILFVVGNILNSQGSSLHIHQSEPDLKPLLEKQRLFWLCTINIEKDKHACQTKFTIKSNIGPVPEYLENLSSLTDVFTIFKGFFKAHGIK